MEWTSSRCPNKTQGTEPELQGWKVNWTLPGPCAPSCVGPRPPPGPRMFSQQELAHILPDISTARRDTSHRGVGTEGVGERNQQACCVTAGKWFCLSGPRFTGLYNENKIKWEMPCVLRGSISGSFIKEL